MTSRMNGSMALATMVASSFLILAAFLPGCGDETPTFRVAGKVLASGDSDDVLAGVTVKCAGSSESCVTGTDGTYSIECPMPAGTDGTTPAAAMIWFEHKNFAPVVKGLVPVSGETFTVVPVMLKQLVQSNVDIPSGNGSVAVPLGAMTLSFERDALLDANGTPLAGNVQFLAASWDDSLPVEEDESTGETVMDALYPPWTPYRTDNSDDGAWMRPISAGWLDVTPASLNPDVPVEMKLFSRFATDVAGREVDQAGDANVYLIGSDMANPEKVDGAALTATNQVSMEAVRNGLAVWMVPVDKYACVDVTVMKGEVPASGAQVTMFETFNGELELFSDEMIGSVDGGYCLKAVSGKQLQVLAWLNGKTAVMSAAADILSIGNATCGGNCAAVTLNFPCEINEECDTGDTCVDGACIPPTAI